MAGYYEKERSFWRPGSWSRRAWLILGSAVVLIVVVVVGAVVGVRATRNSSESTDKRYPDYFKINYALADTYSPSNFFDKFTYFWGYDPAQGFVHYAAQEDALGRNLTYVTSSNTILVKVDDKTGPDDTPNASTGRHSVRLESKRQYGPGLFIFDVKHTPYGCGTWPALWLTDPNNWPMNGEIDIMEAVNQAATGNMMALHTTDGCEMNKIRRNMTGTATHVDCHNATDSNAGCVVTAPKHTYGEEFNRAGGGIVALEWRNEGIRAWMFGRNNVPNDITLAGQEQQQKVPDPSTWGPALADFPATKCDIGGHFKNQSIIVNIDLCGALPNAVWGQSGCGPASCDKFVADNPAAFSNAFWEFGGFQVYQAV